MIDRYDCPSIREIWSTKNRLSIWRDIEISFLRNLKGINIYNEDIPVIDEKAILEISEIEEETRHDVAAFVEWLEKKLFKCIGSESRFVHYGLTSSDIVDTGFSLMLRSSEKEIAVLSRRLQNSIFLKSSQYKGTQLLARTHGQAAEITYLSQKLSSHANAIHGCDSVILDRAYYGKLSGSVGDNKYFPLSVSENVLREFRLANFYSDGQIIGRFIYAKVMNDWATLASVLARIATDIRLLSQTGIEEIFEGFGAGQVGSSSMPHKRNPVLSENICGLARVMRGYQTAIMQDIELWNERDISHSSAERMIFPSAAVTLGFMITRMTEIFDSLVVDTGQMSRNISSQSSKVNSQKEMLELIEKGSTRKEAHLIMKQKAQG